MGNTDDKQFFYFLQDKLTGMYHLQSTSMGGNSSLCGKKELKTVRCILSGKKFIDDQDDMVYQVVSSTKNRRTKREMRLLVASLQAKVETLPSFFEEDESFEGIDTFETPKEKIELTEAEKALKLYSPGICGKCVAQLYSTLEEL